MAIKEKKKEEKSRLLTVLTTDYKWENLLLGTLAIFAIALAVMIINGSLTIGSDFPILGKGNNGIIFAWFMLLISLVGLFLVLFPFFYSAWPEMRRVTWPKGKTYLDSVIRTFIFTILLTLILMLYDVIIVATIGKVV